MEEKGARRVKEGCERAPYDPSSSFVPGSGRGLGIRSGPKTASRYPRPAGNGRPSASSVSRRIDALGVARASAGPVNRSAGRRTSHPPRSPRERADQKHWKNTHTAPGCREPHRAKDNIDSLYWTCFAVCAHYFRFQMRKCAFPPGTLHRSSLDLLVLLLAFPLSANNRRPARWLSKRLLARMPLHLFKLLFFLFFFQCRSTSGACDDGRVTGSTGLPSRPSPHERCRKGGIGALTIRPECGAARSSAIRGA